MVCAAGVKCWLCSWCYHQAAEIGLRLHDGQSLHSWREGGRVTRVRLLADACFKLKVNHDDGFERGETLGPRLLHTRHTQHTTEASQKHQQKQEQAERSVCKKAPRFSRGMQEAHTFRMRKRPGASGLKPAEGGTRGYIGGGVLHIRAEA